jgi:23S rRNA pseudoU1915 N3-methylase RlmH
MAYPSSKGRPTAQILADASKVKNHPRVKERIEEYISKAERYASYNPAKLRQVAIETIMSIAQNQKSRDSDRLKAAELLGKMSQVNLFTSQSDTQSVAQLSDRIDLEQKLRSLLSIQPKAEAVQVIDITPHSIEDDS